MQDYEINYIPFNHPEWNCSEYVKAKDNYEAIEKARKKIIAAHGKNGFTIVNVQRIEHMQ